MKKPLIFLVALLTGSIITFAQEPDTTSLQPLKNQISLQFAPSASLFGIDLKGNVIELAYKRDLGKYKLRSGVMGRSENTENYLLPQKLVLGDSSYSLQKSTARTDQLLFSLGIERNRQFDRINFYYGIDLAGGYSETETLFEKSNYKQDNVSGDYYFVDLDIDKGPKSYKNLALGLKTDVGIQYDLNRRIFVGAALVATMMYTDHQPYLSKEAYSSFDFEQNVMLNLGCRF